MNHARKVHSNKNVLLPSATLQETANPQFALQDAIAGGQRILGHLLVNQNNAIYVEGSDGTSVLQPLHEGGACYIVLDSSASTSANGASISESALEHPPLNLNFVSFPIAVGTPLEPQTSAQEWTTSINSLGLALNFLLFGMEVF